MQLSKSDYMMYLKHPAWLWLKKFDKHKLPAIDAATQAMFDTGHAFETYAEQLFPGGMQLGFNDYDEYLTLSARTTHALQEGVGTIFQGRFEYGQLTFICDIIQVVEGKTIDLYEIKSSTSAKPEHITDLAFQLHVLEGCGYEVRNVAVIHVNNQYVRSGDIDPKEITTVTDVTEEVKAKSEFTSKKTEEALKSLDKRETPDFSPLLADPKALADWLEVYRHMFNPKKGSIYDLCYLNYETLEQLINEGIEYIKDIPSDFKLNTSQAMQVEASKQGRPSIKKDKVKEFLDSLKFPLYFLDYETMASLVPYFDGMRPYQQVPFQYSLHVLESQDAELQHFEYLHTENSNPVEGLCKKLQEQIGTSGSVITWNMSFEKGCNKTMGELCLEYQEFHEALNERIVDLKEPFAKGWYVDADFCGSSSIKKVLPVLVPELSYKELGIQEGASAQRLWMEAVLDEKRQEEKQKILDDLIAYCKLDTLAMVEIYRKLCEL